MTWPGLIHPNHASAFAIHSMSVTRAVRFHAPQCSTPIFVSSHIAPAERPSKAGMTTTSRTSPVAAAASSAGSSVVR